VDKNGNERELHVDKALKVTSLKKFQPSVRTVNEKGTLAKSEYFTVNSVQIAGKTERRGEKDTFICLTCVDGNGTIDGEKVCRGDSFFIPAGHGKFVLDGAMQLIETKIE
jgi:mannose-6-phosphate isomerase